MAGSRILVVYYSRSGTTRKIAEALSEALTCDLEEIVEDTSRSGLFGYMRSLVEARQKRPSMIVPAKREVSSYEEPPPTQSSVMLPCRLVPCRSVDQKPETLERRHFIRALYSCRRGLSTVLLADPPIVPHPH